MKLQNNLDARNFEVQNAKFQVLGGDPSFDATNEGRFWYDSVSKRFRGWDGAVAHTLTNLIEQIVGDGTIGATLSGKRIDLAIPAASGAVRGTMAAADKTKLDAATQANAASTLVQRDANGDFSAANITAHLIGLADNSTLLGGQTLSQVRDFAQTSGQRDHTAINDFDTQVRTGTRLDQLAAPTLPVAFNGQRASGGADPTQAQDFATKNYVDSVATGLDPKASVKWATTAALPTCVYANGASGVGATLTASANGLLGTVGGGTPAVNDRILVKNQATGGQNGFYIVTSVGSAGSTWVLTRTTDADQAAEVSGGMFTFVETGTLASTGWVLNATGAIVMGTTALTFQQFSGAGTYTAGNGLSLTGTSFAVVGTANRVSVSGSGVDIAANYVGQATITTLGAVGTGTWQATSVAVAYGGTGGTTPATARGGIGATGKNAGDVPMLAAGGTYTLTHGLNSLDVIPALIEVSTGDVVLADLKIVDANNVRLTSGAAIAAGAYRIVVIG